MPDWTGLQADAKGEAKAGSNAVAKARAWIENKGSLATFLAAAGIALVGQELLKRTAGAVPRMVMNHHQGISVTRLKMFTVRLHIVVARLRIRLSGHFSKP